MEGKPDALATSGVYSDNQIKQALHSGQIIIWPYDQAHLNGSSYDITLGYYYFRTEAFSERPIYNPFDSEDVERYFDGPYRAISHQQWAELQAVKLQRGIPPEHPIIALKPGERILAHSHEFVGINPPGTTSMRARSSWGRNGVVVCLDAGWGDPGYINRWTMEIYNLNQRETVILPVGERLAQIVFHHTGEVSSSYAQLSGKYQADRQLADLIRTWSPDQLIPKSYKDARRLPPKIEGMMYD